MAFAYTKLMQAMVAAGVVTPTDPYFNLVTLLLPGNGTNGAQNNTFLDSSTNNFTITRNGNTTQGTFSPFSQTGWSGYFDGSSDLTWSGVTIGSNAFTVEFWIYSTVDFSSQRTPIGVQSTSGYNSALEIRMSGTTINASQYLVANNNFTVPSLQANTWYHVAITRNSSNLMTVFLNGTRSSTGALTIATNFSGATSAIGRLDPTNGHWVTGYISNVRIVTGSNIYDPNSSTITVPTAPLTAVSGTQFLALQDNRWIDRSSNASAITVSSGTPSVQAFSPFAPTAAYSASTNGGSGYFDGSGDYLTSSGDFFSGQGTARTFQCWLYVLALPGSGTSQGIFSGANSGGNLSFRYDSSGTLKLDNTGTAEIATSASGAIKAGQWTHVAVTRTTGNLYTLYVNGSSVGSGTNNTNMGSSTYLASLTGGSTLNGYMTDIRVTNTVETINVPTAPLTAISGTALLLNFTNAGITDATAKNDLETVGNASISTAQSKFGGSSMYFDGTGDYLSATPKIQSNAMQGGNATIEMWVYSSNSSSSLKCLIDTRSGQGTDTGYGIYQIANNVVIYGNGVKGNAAGQLAGNTWTHLAVTRANTTNYVFIGGTLYNTFTYGNTLTSSNVTIGSDVAASNAFTGYIDDLRITNGFARYTANFTPTTTTFPLQ